MVGPGRDTGRDPAAGTEGSCVGQGASGDAPGSAQKDPRGGAGQGHMGTKGCGYTTPVTPQPRGPGVPEGAWGHMEKPPSWGGGTWRCPEGLLRERQTGVYGETPPGRAGMGHVLQPHRRGTGRGAPTV